MLVRLGDYIDITNGYAFKSSLYSQSGGRVIRITNVQKGIIKDDNPKFYLENKLKNLDRYKIAEKDILMSLTGNVGRVGKFPRNLLPAYINQRVCRVKSNSEELLDDYLYHILNSNEFENRAVKSSTGIAQLNLSTKWVEEFQIPLPSLATQKRIAEILDNAAALRDKTKQMLEEYDLLAQSIFLEMFGDPVTNTKGWKMEFFKNLCKNLDSKRVPIKQSDRDKMRGDFPYYGATGIVDYINDFIFDGEFLLVAEDGKNLVNRKKPIAWIVEGKFWVNNHAHILIQKENSNLTYLTYHFNNINISNYITGIDQFKLNRGNLDRIKFMVPPIDLQNKFAEKITLIEQQKELANQELKESENLFHALLQKAFKAELVRDEKIEMNLN